MKYAEEVQCKVSLQNRYKFYELLWFCECVANDILVSLQHNFNYFLIAKECYNCIYQRVRVQTLNAKIISELSPLCSVYFKKRTKICIPVPLYHCFGMVFGRSVCIFDFISILGLT